MLHDRIFDIKSELKQTAKGDLLKMAFSQKEKEVKEVHLSGKLKE